MSFNTSERHVCWRAAEHHPFESAWSLLNKFCRWNRAHYADVWELIAVDTRRVPSAARFPLANPDWIDRAKFARWLKLSATTGGDAFTTRYLGRGGDSAAAILSAASHVRYCPRCIARGYHSPLHDLLFIPNCPIHEEPLQFVCPKCSQPIDQALPRTANHDAYSCRCGHFYWGVEQSPAFTEEQVGRLRETVAWIDRILPKLLVNFMRLARLSEHTPRSAGHIANLVAYLRDIEPALAPPKFLVRERPQAKEKGTHVSLREGL